MSNSLFLSTDSFFNRTLSTIEESVYLSKALIVIKEAGKYFCYIEAPLLQVVSLPYKLAWQVCQNLYLIHKIAFITIFASRKLEVKGLDPEVGELLLEKTKEAFQKGFQEIFFDLEMVGFSFFVNQFTKHFLESTLSVLPEERIRALSKGQVEKILLGKINEVIVEEVKKGGKILVEKGFDAFSAFFISNIISQMSPQSEELLQRASLLAKEKEDIFFEIKKKEEGYEIALYMVNTTLSSKNSENSLQFPVYYFDKVTEEKLQELKPFLESWQKRGSEQLFVELSEVPEVLERHFGSPYKKREASITNAHSFGSKEAFQWVRQKIALAAPSISVVQRERLFLSLQIVDLSAAFVQASEEGSFERWVLLLQTTKNLQKESSYLGEYPEKENDMRTLDEIEYQIKEKMELLLKETREKEGSFSFFNPLFSWLLDVNNPFLVKLEEGIQKALGKNYKTLRNHVLEKMPSVETERLGGREKFFALFSCFFIQMISLEVISVVLGFLLPFKGAEFYVLRAGLSAFSIQHTKSLVPEKYWKEFNRVWGEVCFFWIPYAVDWGYKFLLPKQDQEEISYFVDYVDAISFKSCLKELRQEALSSSPIKKGGEKVIPFLQKEIEEVEKVVSTQEKKEAEKKEQEVSITPSFEGSYFSFLCDTIQDAEEKLESSFFVEKETEEKPFQFYKKALPVLSKMVSQNSYSKVPFSEKDLQNIGEVFEDRIGLKRVDYTNGFSEGIFCFQFHSTQNSLLPKSIRHETEGFLGKIIDQLEDKSTKPSPIVDSSSQKPPHAFKRRVVDPYYENEDFTDTLSFRRQSPLKPPLEPSSKSSSSSSSYISPKNIVQRDDERKETDNPKPPSVTRPFTEPLKNPPQNFKVGIDPEIIGEKRVEPLRESPSVVDLRPSLTDPIQSSSSSRPISFSNRKGAVSRAISIIEEKFLLKKEEIKTASDLGRYLEALCVFMEKKRNSLVEFYESQGSLEVSEREIGFSNYCLFQEQIERQFIQNLLELPFFDIPIKKEEVEALLETTFKTAERLKENRTLLLHREKEYELVLSTLLVFLEDLEEIRNPSYSRLFFGFTTFKNFFLRGEEYGIDESPLFDLSEKTIVPLEKLFSKFQSLNLKNKKEQSLELFDLELLQETKLEQFFENSLQIQKAKQGTYIYLPGDRNAERRLKNLRLLRTGGISLGEREIPSYLTKDVREELEKDINTIEQKNPFYKRISPLEETFSKYSSLREAGAILFSNRRDFIGGEDVRMHYTYKGVIATGYFDFGDKNLPSFLYDFLSRLKSLKAEERIDPAHFSHFIKYAVLWKKEVKESPELALLLLETLLSLKKLNKDVFSHAFIRVMPLYIFTEWSFYVVKFFHPEVLQQFLQEHNLVESFFSFEEKVRSPDAVRTRLQILGSYSEEEIEEETLFQGFWDLFLFLKSGEFDSNVHFRFKLDYEKKSSLQSVKMLSYLAIKKMQEPSFREKLTKAVAKRSGEIEGAFLEEASFKEFVEVFTELRPTRKSIFFYSPSKKDGILTQDGKIGFLPQPEEREGLHPPDRQPRVIERSVILKNSFPLNLHVTKEEGTRLIKVRENSGSSVFRTYEIPEWIDEQRLDHVYFCPDISPFWFSSYIETFSGIIPPILRAFLRGGSYSFYEGDGKILCVVKGDREDLFFVQEGNVWRLINWGATIAEEQKIPSLDFLENYLVLEEGGKKKVLYFHSFYKELYLTTIERFSPKGSGFIRKFFFLFPETEKLFLALESIGSEKKKGLDYKMLSISEKGEIAYQDFSEISLAIIHSFYTDSVQFRSLCRLLRHKIEMGAIQEKKELFALILALSCLQVGSPSKGDFSEVFRLVSLFFEEKEFTEETVSLNIRIAMFTSFFTLYASYRKQGDMVEKLEEVEEALFLAELLNQYSFAVQKFCKEERLSFHLEGFIKNGIFSVLSGIFSEDFVGRLQYLDKKYPQLGNHRLVGTLFEFFKTSRKIASSIIIPSLPMPSFALIPSEALEVPVQIGCYLVSQVVQTKLEKTGVFLEEDFFSFNPRAVREFFPIFVKALLPKKEEEAPVGTPVLLEKYEEGFFARLQEVLPATLETLIIPRENRFVQVLQLQHLVKIAEKNPEKSQEECLKEALKKAEKEIWDFWIERKKDAFVGRVIHGASNMVLYGSQAFSIALSKERFGQIPEEIAKTVLGTSAKEIGRIVQGGKIVVSLGGGLFETIHSQFIKPFRIELLEEPVSDLQNVAQALQKQEEIMQETFSFFAGFFVKEEMPIVRTHVEEVLSQEESPYAAIRIQASFEERNKKPPVLSWKFREDKDPFTLQSEVLSLQENLTVSIEQLEKGLYRLFKAYSKRLFSFIELEEILLKKNGVEEIQNILSCTQSEAELFCFRLACLSFYKGYLVKLNKVKDILIRNGSLQEKGTEIASILLEKRSYSFSEDPFFAISCMVFEARSQMWLRQDQIRQLQASNRAPFSVMEAIPGFGKTAAILPMLSQICGKKGSISLLVFTRALIDSSKGKIGKAISDAFGREVSLISFAREHTIPFLRRAFLKVQKAQEMGEILITTKEDLQCLWLSCVDLLHNAKKRTNEEEIKWDLLSSILATLYKNSSMIVDECHEAFSPEEVEKFPITEEAHLQKKDISGVKIVFESLLQIAEEKGISIEKVLSTKKLFKESSALLAEKVASFFPFSEEEKKALLAYLQSYKEEPPTFLLEENPYFASVASARGVILSIIPSLQEEEGAKVSYGRSSIEKEKRFMIPYSGNNKPEEGSSFESPYGTLARSFSYYLQKGISNEEARLIHSLLEKEIAEEMKENQCKEEETETIAFLQKIFRTDKVTLDAFSIEEIQKNERMILFFVEKIVAPTIPYYPFSIDCTASDFAFMGKTVKALSGTIFNKSLYPQGFSYAEMRETTANSLALIEKALEGGSITKLPDNSSREELRDAVIEEMVQDAEGMLLIDLGNLFDGIENGDVASIIWTKVRSIRPEIEGVVFFDEKNHMQILTARGTIPFSEDKFPKEKRICYLDGNHFYGVDIAQKQGAKAHITVGDNSLADFQQASLRLRGIEEKHQKLSLHLMPEVSLEDPSFSELVLFLTGNEERELVKGSLQAAFQKLNAVLRKEIMIKLLSSTSSTRENMFAAFSDLFVSEKSFSAISVFGTKREEVRTEGFIQNWVEKWALRVRNSKYLEPSEKQKIEKALTDFTQDFLPTTTLIEGINPINTHKTVRVKEKQREKQQEKTQEKTQEHQKERQKEAQILLPVSPVEVRKEEYIPWDPDLSLDNFVFRKDNTASLPKILQQSSQKGWQLFSHLMEDTMGATHNLVPYQKGWIESFLGSSIRDWSQKAGHVLVVIPDPKNEKNFFTIGLSRADALFWEKKLKNSSSKPLYAIFSIWEDTHPYLVTKESAFKKVAQDPSFKRQKALWRAFQFPEKLSQEDKTILEERISTVIEEGKIPSLEELQKGVEELSIETLEERIIIHQNQRGEAVLSCVKKMLSQDRFYKLREKYRNRRRVKKGERIDMNNPIFMPRGFF